MHSHTYNRQSAIDDYLKDSVCTGLFTFSLSLIDPPSSGHVIFGLSRNLLCVTQFWYNRVIRFALNLLSFILLFSFYHILFMTEKYAKDPGTRKFQSASSLFKSRKRHLSVKEALPLELSV